MGRIGEARQAFEFRLRRIGIGPRDPARNMSQTTSSGPATSSKSFSSLTLAVPAVLHRGQPGRSPRGSKVRSGPGLAGPHGGVSRFSGAKVSKYGRPPRSDLLDGAIKRRQHPVVGQSKHLLKPCRARLSWEEWPAGLQRWHWPALLANNGLTMKRRATHGLISRSRGAVLFSATESLRPSGINLSYFVVQLGPARLCKPFPSTAGHLCRGVSTLGQTSQIEIAFRCCPVSK